MMKAYGVQFILTVLCLLGLASSKTTIHSTGSFNCAADASDATIRVTDFKLTFDRLTSSVYYSATGTAKETFNATAKIALYIYGIKAIEREVKFCEYGVAELCPVTKNSEVTITGNHTVPAKYVSSISDLAFTIPDIEGNIYIQLYDINDSSKQLGCFRSDITNGNTAEVKSVKWGTAIAAIIALVIAMASSSASQAGSSGAGSGSGGAAPGTDGGATKAATGGGGTGTEAHAAASGQGTNVASNQFQAPDLATLMGWFQTMSVNGVYSLHYPKVYRSFTRNFSWTCGVLEWAGMERSIDRMRKHSGGNLTASSVLVLKNTTLYEDPLPGSKLAAYEALGNSTISKRGLLFKSIPTTFTKRYSHGRGYFIVKRDTLSSVPTTGGSSTPLFSKYVTGIEAYLEKNNIPATNGFTTLLVWWCIVVAVIILFIIGLKVFLELYYTEERMAKIQRQLEEYESASSNFSSLSSSARSYRDQTLRTSRTSRASRLLTRLSIVNGLGFLSDKSVPRKPSKPKFQDFRKNYLLCLRVTMIRVIMILYGVWVLLTLYQFRLNDSWATVLLAALTFAAFTLVLLACTVRIWYFAHVAYKKKAEKEQLQLQQRFRGAEVLFTYKPWISKYGVFYDEFKVKFWWFFVPSLVAVFGRNAFIALGMGHALVQIFGQLAIDVLLCAFFCILTPFNTKMGNILNIIIQVVRIISLILTFLFTDVVSLSKIRSTVVGFILIALQSTLTVVLVLLIIANACKGLLNNFYKTQRKQIKAKKAARRAARNEKLKNGNGDDDDDSNIRQGQRTLFNDEENDIFNHGRDSIQLIDLDSPSGSPLHSPSKTSINNRAGSFDGMVNTGMHRNIFLLDDEESQEDSKSRITHFSDAHDIFSDAAAIPGQSSAASTSEKSATHRNIFEPEFLGNGGTDFNFIDTDGPRDANEQKPAPDFYFQEDPKVLGSSAASYHLDGGMAETPGFLGANIGAHGQVRGAGYEDGDDINDDDFRLLRR